MSRTIDRRQVTAALLRAIALAAGGSMAGCAAGGNGGIGATGAIGTADPQPGGLFSAPTTSTPTKIALILPLTGSAQTAAIAKALRDAAEMALIDAKESGLELIVRDDKGTPDGAKAAAEDAIKAGAELIIGPLFSKAVAAVAPIAKAAGIPVVAFSNDPAVAGNGVYLLSFSQENEISRVISHAASAGKRQFGALMPDDVDGRFMVPAFKTAVATAGGSVAFIERYKIEESGVIDPTRRFREVLKQNAASGERIDALFMPAAQDTLPQLSSLLVQAEFDFVHVRVLGTSGWNYANVQRLNRLHGSWFTAPDPRGWTDFAERYGRSYKSMPPRLATLPHDAVALAAALSKGAKGQRFTAANLTRSSGFFGADGTFRFTAGGQINRDLAIIELQKAGPVVIDRPATALAITPVADALPQRIATPEAQRGPRIDTN